MKNQLLSGVAVVTFAFGNAAVVAPAAAQQPLPVNWTGFYLGGHLGGGQAKFETNDHAGRPFVETKPSGFVGGVHAGYNWQMNSFVFGLEGDIDGASWDERQRNFPTDGRFIDIKVKMFASLRGRVGLAFDSLHIYFTGGFGYTKASYLSHSPSGTENGDGTTKKWGGVLGGGAEWKFHPNWSLRAEALWYDVGVDRKFGTDHFWTHKFENAVQYRGGLTFHF
jgi:outer membrane immunogenic protein